MSFTKDLIKNGTKLNPEQLEESTLILKNTFKLIESEDIELFLHFSTDMAV